MNDVYKKILRIPAGFSEWVLNIESPFRRMRPSMWDIIVIGFLSSALLFPNVLFSSKTMLIFGSGYVIFRMLMRRF